MTAGFERHYLRQPQRAEVAACAEGVWPGEACPELVEGTLYNRWKRWSDKGVFIRMMEGLATPQAPERKTIMIDATPAFAGAGSISRPTARRRALG